MMFRTRRKASTQPIDNRTFDLLSVTAAAVLCLHAPHLPAWLSVSLALVLGYRCWQRRRHAGRVPAWLKVPLLVLLTLAIIVSYGSIVGREPGTALAVGLLVLKLLETETPRDVCVGIGFACFALMSALLLNQGMVPTTMVVLGLLPALATLRSLQPARPQTSLIRALAPGLMLLLTALPLALLGFLLVPRLSTPLWGTTPTTHEATTGLSDSMSPGNFTDLLTDDRPVMRVSFDATVPARNLRYFRAYVMWNYDGRSWQHGDDRSQTAPASLQTSGTSIGYQVTLQPTHQRVLPTMDLPLAAPTNASMQADREIRSDKPIDAPYAYETRSTLSYQLEPRIDEGRRNLGLRLPAGLNPRTLALATQWRQQYGHDDDAIVRAALALFHSGGFRYTLTPAPLGRDAMDEFLFETHEGFCEHYSSAFTILMRAAGIPARVVTGYQGGYWNRLGNYLLVRNSDAHAWSEVWLAGRGWQRIDPTATVRPERVSLGAASAAGDQLSWNRSDWLQNLSNHWDIVNRWWNQAVIGFDAIRQRGLLTPFGVREATTSWLTMLLAIGSVLFIAIGLSWALWQRRPRDPLRAALGALERKLARGGIVRRPTEGPYHYLTRAARALPGQREPLAALMRWYLELRYAINEPPPESVYAFRRAVRDFRIVRVVK